MRQRKFKKIITWNISKKNVIHLRPHQELQTQERAKKSLYSDILKPKRSNTAVRGKSSETNMQPNKQDVKLKDKDTKK